MVMFTLANMLNIVIDTVWWIVVLQFVLGLLISFNVINTRNDAVLTIYRALGALLEPILGPIRRALPHTGAIDFSPLVLILALRLLQAALRPLAYSGY